MNGKLPDPVLLFYMTEQCERIIKLTNGVTFDEFSRNTTLQDAVTRNIEVIGEAAGKLSKEFQKDNPEIEVSKMAGMRNFVIHQYFRVDAETVWNTCIQDIPKLYQSLESLKK